MNRCGFVHMQSQEMADNAIKNLNNSLFNGANIVVERGRMKDRKPNQGGPQGGNGNGNGPPQRMNNNNGPPQRMNNNNGGPQNRPMGRGPGMGGGGGGGFRNDGNDKDFKSTSNEVRRKDGFKGIKLS